MLSFKVSAICTCLYDNQQLLVQRSILDFLLACLPLHRTVLSKKNIIKVMTAILSVLLKCDMSLNRRIYTWFLGTVEFDKDQYQNDDIVDSSTYFMRYTREFLIESLKHLLEIVSLRSSSEIIIELKENKSTMNVIDSLSFSWTLMNKSMFWH